MTILYRPRAELCPPDDFPCFKKIKMVPAILSEGEFPELYKSLKLYHKYTLRVDNTIYSQPVDIKDWLESREDNLDDDEIRFNFKRWYEGGFKLKGDMSILLLEVSVDLNWVFFKVLDVEDDKVRVFSDTLRNSEGVETLKPLFIFEQEEQ